MLERIRPWGISFKSWLNKKLRQYADPVGLRFALTQRTSKLANIPEQRSLSNKYLNKGLFQIAFPVLRSPGNCCFIKQSLPFFKTDASRTLLSPAWFLCLKTSASSSQCFESASAGE
jgi:hypothetical protein